MAHTISERRRRERLKELDPQGWREQRERPRRELRHAKLIVAIWNKRAQRGRPISYFPTIATAIAAKAPMLEVLCPSCRTIARVDLRALDVHPAAPISALIPRLSCWTRPDRAGSRSSASECSTMPTWVLITTVFYAPLGGSPEPRGITSTFGYRSELECNAAGVAALKTEAANTKYMYQCIRGPMQSTAPISPRSLLLDRARLDEARTQAFTPKINWRIESGNAAAYFMVSGDV